MNGFSSEGDTLPLMMMCILGGKHGRTQENGYETGINEIEPTLAE